MSFYAAELNRLALMVERLLDMELLSDAEGTRLLTETHAACRLLEAGDTEAVRRHVEQVARFTEALLADDALVLKDGRAVVETARQILTGDTD